MSARRSMSSAALLGAAAILSACSVPGVDFTGIDASEDVDAVDAPPGDPMLVVSATSVRVDELAEATFDVRLSQPPGDDVLVNVQSSDDIVLGVRPNLLVFDATTWDEPQVVTVSGRRDDDALDSSGSVSLTSSTAGNLTVSVIVEDIDAFEIVTTPLAAVQVDEGATTPVAVRLSAMPAADVVVEVASLASGVAAVAPGTLTFTSSNWETAQDVLVTGVQDDEADHEDTSVTFTSPGSPEVDPTTLVVHVIDDEVLNIAPSLTNLGTLGEGATTSFTVRMTHALTADLDVTISSSDAGALAVSPSTLRFTATSWGMPQTVTVTVPQDNDYAGETPTITLAAAGVMDRFVTAAIADDDVPALEVSAAAVTVLEGATSTLDVNLVYEPPAPVTVNVTTLATSVATVTPATLTFTPANYADPQTITVRGSDDQDAVSGTTAVRLESLAPPLVVDTPVTVMDDDPLRIETDVMSVSLTDTTSAIFRVRLTAAPVGTLDVIPTSSDVSTATVAPAMLSFTAMNWNAYQTVTVTGVHDIDVATETVTIALGSSATPTATVNASVADVDSQTIVASVANLSVLENATGTVGVRLMYQPAANVVVAAASSAPSSASVSPASLTFTPGNFATPQELTITGVDDVDTVDDAATITLSSTGLSNVPVSVNVDDQDELLFVVSPATLTINETSSGSIGVRLSAQPAGNVAVNVTSSDPGAATVAPPTLTFTPGNWNMAQSVTVTGVDDGDVTSESVTVSFVAAGLPSATAMVSVTDDDPLNILTSVGSVAITEPGSATFQVRLSQMPPGNVTVNVASADGGAATVSPSSLSFSTTSWGTYQTVTVQSVDDADLVDESVAINLTGAGLMPASVTAAVDDPDVQAIELSASTLTMLEGASGSVTVRLAYLPAGNVVVTASSGNAAVATAAPAMLTFTPANFAMPQTLTVAGVEDPDAAPGATSVTLSTPGVASAAVAVTVNDNDPLDITTSAATVTVGEAGTGTVGVKLTAQPSGDVVVNVTSSDTGAATASPATLTFTTTSWDTYQNVTLAGVNDDDAAHESVTVTLSGSGVSSRTVAVSVTDDDPLTIVTSVATMSLTEPGTATFTVRLGAQPQASTTVTVTSADTSAITVSPASLVFSTSTWSTAQTVTVTSVNDPDMVGETVALSLVATGIPTATVTATVTDPDQQQVLAAPSTLTVLEGGTGNVSVSLAYQPASNVTVTVSLDSAIATANAAMLTFTPANYATGQTLTIAGVQDTDGVDDTTTVSLTANGAQSGSVALTIDDDELQVIVASVSSIAVNEGGTGTFSLRLSAQPSANVIVAVASNATSEATVSPSQLTFTTSNWNMNQTVTVTGVQDSGSLNESAIVSATATNWTTASVTVTVHDNDTLSPFSTTYAMYEQESAVVLQVRLSAQPLANVVVGVASNDTGALTVSTPSLTFTPSNWNTYQNVTLTGVNDTDTTNESVTVALTATGFSTQNVAVTVHDDDTIALSSSSIVVGEGQMTTFTVRLLAQPRETRAVGITFSPWGVASASPISLNFSASNWSTPQTVTLTGTADADRTNDATTIFASSTYLAQKSASLGVYEFFTVTIDPWTDNGGTGTVTGTGINCSVPGTGTCTKSVMYGDSLALHAMPAANQAYWGWTNCEPWWAVDCSLTVNADVTVRAQFPRTVRLTVTKAGNGVVTEPDYDTIDCGTQCAWDYHWPVIGVRLQATPAAGSSFAYWTGECAGQGALCTMDFDVNTSTHAVFTSP